jgi:hypothetical protein
MSWERLVLSEDANLHETRTLGYGHLRLDEGFQTVQETSM